MQFLILLIGILVFTFYQYQQPPLFFNKYELGKLERSQYQAELSQIKSEYNQAFSEKQQHLAQLNNAIDQENKTEIDRSRTKLQGIDQETKSLRTKLTNLMQKNDPEAEINDNNYIFLSFVTQYLPKGLIGLLIAIIFLASMGSTASALNSLASTTVVDIYKRLINANASEKNYLLASRLSTIGWGAVCIVMALYASKLGNLIEAVNILGSYIYGTILGVFLVAFYVKHVEGKAVFFAAVLTEIIVCVFGYYKLVAYLWLNVIGCLNVVLLAVIIQAIIKKPLAKIQAA
jgi:Na+(H+)/acetate symporter ActP